MDISNIIEKIIRNKTPIALILLVFVAGGFVSSIMFNRFDEPVDASDTSRMTVMIPVNSTANDIARILKDKDLIRNEAAFLQYCKENGVDSALKAGYYSLSRSDSMPEIAGIIASGQTDMVSFTVEEGYTVDKIGEELEKAGLCTEADWKQAVKYEYQYPFLKDAPGDTKHRIEGFLFPDTYKFNKNMGAQAMIDMMLRRFQEVWEQEFAEEAAANGKEMWVVMTEASMIEKEAALDSERARIAGVINNRLKISMKLQFCSTVIYSMAKPKTTVSYADLEIDSPYNTYKYKGLPPGPISSPSKKSIAAAIHPEEHEYLYFVAIGDGSHHFSKTYEEHMEAQQ